MAQAKKPVCLRCVTACEEAPMRPQGTQQSVCVADCYVKEQSTANSTSFKIAQKTAFEVKGRLYTTGKVIQRLFIVDVIVCHATQCTCACAHMSCPSACLIHK